MNIYSGKTRVKAEIKPLVSIIIAAYNAEAFIGRTLESILLQTYRSFEVLVVDDGSQDGTVGIIREYSRLDARIQLFQQANGGVASARNVAVERSKGQFIAPIDADDIAYPKNIERQVQCLLEAPSSVGVSYVWSIDIDEHDVPTGKFRASEITGEVYPTLLCHNFLGNASSTLIRRDCFDKVGLYDTRFKDEYSQGCEDWDLYLRLAQNYKFQVVPEFLLGYRKLPNSMSSNFKSMAKWHDLTLKVAAHRKSDIPGFLYRLSRSNFYMYLAQESDSTENPRSTLYWLYQALRAEWITPCLRYGLYKLTFTSLIRLMAQVTLASGKDSNQSSGLSHIRQAQRSQKHLTITNIEEAKAKTRIKVFIWSMFQVAVSIIATSRQHDKFSNYGPKR